MRSLINGPLPGLFYLRNKSRAIPLFFLVAFSVAIISVVATLTGSILDSIYSVEVLPQEHFTIVFSKQLTISEEITFQIDKLSVTERQVPFLDSSIRVMGFFGSEARRIYALGAPDIEFFLERLNLQLSHGALPRSGTNDIVLHEDILNAKGINLGDFVGQEIDKEDYLWGEFRVSGILFGDIPLGIASLDFFKDQWMFDLGDRAYALMAFPEKGKIAQMNDVLLQSLPQDLINLRTFDNAYDNYKVEAQNMDLLLWIVNLAIVTVISLSMGLLNTIHFLGRMKEYGTLSLIGLKTNQLILRSFLEVLIMTFFGFLGGIAFSVGLIWGLSSYVFEPKGVSIGMLTIRNLLFTLPIPVLLALFSFITIGWSVKRMDVISIIEDRD